MWTLAPPESHLIFPTRVPFEESTVWGRAEDAATIDGAKVFILKPGDMLIIPPKWWHTTRSLDLSISVNIWNKLPQIDEKSRESEAATRILSEIARCSELIRFKIIFVKVIVRVLSTSKSHSIFPRVI